MATQRSRRHKFRSVLARITGKASKPEIGSEASLSTAGSPTAAPQLSAQEDKAAPANPSAAQNGSLDTQPTLWDTAYDSLRGDPDDSTTVLLDRYERLLSRVLVRGVSQLAMEYAEER